MPTDPRWIDASSGAPSYTAQELRQMDAMLAWPVTDRFGARAGVRPGGAASISNVGTTLSVDRMLVMVYPTGNLDRGPYTMTVAPTTYTIPAAGASTRLDLVVAEIKDHVYDSSGLRQAQTTYVTGTPGAGQPATPAGTVLLAVVTMTSGGVATTSYAPLWTVALGGTLPIATAADRPTTGLYPGMTCYQIDIASIITYNGSAWITLGEPVVSTSSGLVNASSWTCTWNAYRMPGGFLTASLICNYTSGAGWTADNKGNFTDTTMVTIPSGWRPIVAWSMVGDAGSGSGFGATIGTDGVCNLRAGPANFVMDTTVTVRFGASWKLA